MKKLFLLLPMLLCLLGTVQAQLITDFWGIPWGASQAETLKTLTTTKKCTADPSLDTADIRVVTGTFATYRDCMILTMFDNGKLMSGGVYFPYTQGTLLEDYKDILKMLISKYGTPTENYRYFVTPYYEGDGYEESAISLGKGFLGASWTQGDQEIMLLVDRKMRPFLRYSNSVSTMNTISEAGQQKAAEDL